MQCNRINSVEINTQGLQILARVGSVSIVAEFQALGNSYTSGDLYNTHSMFNRIPLRLEFHIQ